MGLCAIVEGAIGATSWPIRGSCCVSGKVRTGMLLAMTECNCDLRRLGGGWSFQLRSGLGTRARAEPRRPGVCTCSSPRLSIHFFESANFLDSSSPVINSTTHHPQCLRSESPFQSARRRVCATVSRKNLPRSKESSASKQKTFVNFSSTYLPRLEY
jgi:hypothetical protein